MDKKFVNLIPPNLSLLCKNIDKYFLSLYVSSLDWVRALFVLRPKLAELTVAEGDELAEIRNGEGLKLKHSPTQCLQF